VQWYRYYNKKSLKHEVNFSTYGLENMPTLSERDKRYSVDHDYNSFQQLLKPVDVEKKFSRAELRK
jgi:hypothetical protein